MPAEQIFGQETNNSTTLDHNYMVIDRYGSIGISAGDSASVDAFGRWRVSNPETIFDSKNIFNDPDLATSVENQPIFYDNQETSGTGTTTTYNANQASNTIAVSANTAGTRVRQTFRRFNYQPLKSQLNANTFVFGQGLTSGITIREGLFDEENGLFLESSDDYYFVRRTNASGTPADNKVARADWNLDPMDGTGRSGINLDFTKTQILIADYEWLGVGRIRMGFVVGGRFIYAHEFKNANSLSVVYMSTPNLPIRTEITNDGTGAAASVTQICSSVLSEGGTQELGQPRATPVTNPVSLATAGTAYLGKAIQLRAGYEGLTAKLLDLDIYPSSNAVCLWELKFKATLSGVPSGGLKTQAQSGISYAEGDGTVTVSGGYLMKSGIASGRTSLSREINEALALGCSIAGAYDVIALVLIPTTNSQSVYCSLGWREL